MGIEALEATAAALAAPGKGLLASDESPGTIGKRLTKLGLENTPESRRAYREILYTAPRIGEAYSGVIMHPETLLQSTSDGTPFVEVLARQGVLAGVKVDEGLAPLEGGEEGETETKGLESLAAACERCVASGARFAKWRAALKVTPDGACPSARAVSVNAAQLADYAAICQSAGLVPIVEPEILIDGAHDAQTFAAASERVISACVAACLARGVRLEASLLKPQMVVPGTDYAGPRPSSNEVAELTLLTLRRCVPPAIPGIMFLSGGQTEEEATRNLDAINRRARADAEAGRGLQAPWALSFSFGRGLQASVLQVWAAKGPAGADEARAVASALALANAAAARGAFEGETHPSLLGAGGTLHETFRGWSNPVPVAASLAK